MIEAKDIPQDVLFVWGIQGARQSVGLSTYNEVSDIIKKYPEWFKWETAYDKIPQYVHDAYRGEAYSYEMVPIKRNEGFVGMIPTLLAEPEIVDRNTGDRASIFEMFAKLFENDLKERERKEAERIERKRVWDKHYSKYGLEYRD
jgi:hypothetical protein